MHDQIDAAGAVAVIVGVLLLGLSGNKRTRARSFCLIFGWLMVIFGVGAVGVTLVQSARSTSAADAPS